MKRGDLVLIAIPGADRLMTVPREKIGVAMGKLSQKQMYKNTKLLALWIGIAED